MENNSFYSVSVSQLLKYYNMGQGIKGDIFATSQLKEYINVFSFPLRLNAMIFFVCHKGTIDITTNMVEWKLGESTYAIGVPETVIGINHISDDFEGFVVLFSVEYLRRLNIDLKEVWPYYVYIRNYPCIKVKPRLVKEISQFYRLIYYTLEEKGGRWKENIINGLVASMIFKVCEDLDEAGLDRVTLKTKSKEYYYTRFIELLLHSFRKHHNVRYYSEKLALSPKYLSSLMKEITGLSAAQWIDKYIIAEAQTLLKFSNMTIQQISDCVHFANQSFFSKFFRQHVGMTPSEYRSNKVN